MGEWDWNKGDFNIKNIKKEKREGGKYRKVERDRGQFEIWSLAKPDKHVAFI